jgi:anti-sigma B factor antagonist
MGERTDQASPALAITQRTQGRWRVYGLQGELTHATCDELAQALDGEGEGEGEGTGRPCIAVDASGLEFFDSAGIRCLLIAARRIQGQGREFVVLDAGRLVRRIHWMNLTQMLPVMAALPA